MNENVRPGPGGWSDIEIAIGPSCLPGEPRSVRAQLIGPFAIHRAHDDQYRFVVTHIRTGASVREFFSMADARGCASELRSMLANTELDTDDVHAVAARIKDVDYLPVLAKWGAIRRLFSAPEVDR